MHRSGQLFGKLKCKHELVPAKPAQDPEALAWNAVLAERKAEEQRFGASHWADLDTTPSPLKCIFPPQGVPWIDE